MVLVHSHALPILLNICNRLFITLHILLMRNKGCTLPSFLLFKRKSAMSPFNIYYFEWISHIFKNVIAGFYFSGIREILADFSLYNLKYGTLNFASTYARYFNGDKIIQISCALIVLFKIARNCTVFPKLFDWRVSLISHSK